MMNPTWQTDDGRVKLWLGDCLPLLDSVEADACIADPPYGIAYDASKSSQQGITPFAMIAGDNEPFDPTPFYRFSDVITWGCNNYCDKIPPHEGQWYCWDKVTRNSLGVRIAECEYAWHKQGTKPRAFRHLWSGAYRASEAGEPSLHPNQKPVALMEWCVSMVKGEAILDPFMGSGTTGVACVRLGRKFLGVEKEPKYFEIAKRRIIAELERMPLFEDKPSYTQAELIA